MREIFICYRRDDAEGQAGRLFDDLSQHFGGDAVFMDVAAIEPGRDFRRAIDEQVASCGVLLALIGKSWLTANDESGARRLDDQMDLVRLEIAFALKRDIPVVPVLVHGARMPRAEDLPEDLKALAFRNAVELTHTRWDSDVQVLVKALRPYVKAKQEPTRPSPPPPREPGSTWNSSRMITAALVSVLVLVFSAYVWQQKSLEDAAWINKIAHLDIYRGNTLIQQYNDPVNANNPIQRRQIRNELINGRIALIDIQFKELLQGLATDADKTMPALMEKMKAQRKSLLVGIQTGLLNRTDAQYPLLQALADLDDYSDAGTISRAITGVIQSAGNEAAEADRQLLKLLEKVEFELGDPAASIKRVIFPDPSSTDLDPAGLQRVKECWPEAGLPPDTLVLDFVLQPAFASERGQVAACMGL